MRRSGGWAARRRPGSASLEAVLATGISLPVVLALFSVGVRAARRFYFVAADLVGWPYM